MSVVPPPISTNATPRSFSRSEEHTSELQSRRDLVCRLLLEKKHNELRLVVVDHAGVPQAPVAQRRVVVELRARAPQAARRQDPRARVERLPGFFFKDSAPPGIRPLSLPRALPQ